MHAGNGRHTSDHLTSQMDKCNEQRQSYQWRDSYKCATFASRIHSRLAFNIRRFEQIIDSKGEKQFVTEQRTVNKRWR